MRAVKIGILFILGVTLGFLIVPHTPKSSAPVLNTVAGVEDASPKREVSEVATSSIPNGAHVASIVRIVDGDTIAILLNGNQETVRLIGINAPESVDPRKPVECFGREASEHLRELLPLTATIYIGGDGTQDTRDKYGRLLGYVFLDTGEFINERMIREGYAYEYTYKTPYHYQSEFMAAEDTAHKKEIGLWAPDACNNPTGISDTSAPNQSSIICTKNAYNCSDFKTQAEAQAVLEACGVATDIHKLDADGNGKACESLK